jgi:hypothetical protein
LLSIFHCIGILICIHNIIPLIKLSWGIIFCILSRDIYFYWPFRLESIISSRLIIMPLVYKIPCLLGVCILNSISACACRLCKARCPIKCAVKLSSYYIVFSCLAFRCYINYCIINRFSNCFSCITSSLSSFSSSCLNSITCSVCSASNLSYYLRIASHPH